MLNDRLVRWLSRPTKERGINTVTGMPVTLHTDVGLVRNENQDRVAVMRATTTSAKPFVVIALVDGMGGMTNGAECATRTLSAFFNALIRFRQKLPQERLELAANIANMTVYEFSKGRGGATLSALFVDNNQALILNVGDSRIYATTVEDNVAKVIRLTVDDSLEEAVGGHGKELLQFIGMGDGLVPHVSVVPQTAKRILITSDGIHFIRHESLCDVLLNTQGSTQVAEQLGALAMWRGAPDNASLAITTLPKLTQSLSVSEETGIEIWDPFSALHVMWLQQEQADIPNSPKPPNLITPIQGNLLSKNVRPAKSPSTRANLPKNVKKIKVTKAGKKSTTPIAAPKLIFEINSETNQGKDK